MNADKMLRAKPMAQLNAALQEAVGPASGVAEQGHSGSGVLRLVVPLVSLWALPGHQTNWGPALH